MRPLYPSAFHNRFVHSLGVYHLARIAFHQLQRNTDPSLLIDSVTGMKINLREEYEYPFIVAALMHDCGHAPFSHIFENYYRKNQQAEKLLKQYVDSDFVNDFEFKESTEGASAPHEIFSAAIFLKHYRQAYLDEKPFAQCVDPIFVARMITGCTHSTPTNHKQKVENALIKLLNGNAIDLDKLDYIVRDTWNSGVDNVTVDISRLLAALKLSTYNDLIVPVFKQSALSAIQNVLLGRNFFYRWIFSHHIVSYYFVILEEAVYKLFKIISNNKPDKLISLVFSDRTFSEIVKYKKLKFYLPADYDFYHLLKQYGDHIEIKPLITELFSHKPELVPLWKTREEFEIIFDRFKEEKKDVIKNSIKKILSHIITSHDANSRIRIIEKDCTDFPDIEEDKLYIEIRQQVKSYKKLLPRVITTEIDNSFFYVFIPCEYKNRINDCIAAIENTVIDF
jgi:HD superfamily phosphohydrolase